MPRKVHHGHPAKRRADLSDGAKDGKEQIPTRWGQAPGAFEWPRLPELPEVPFLRAMLRRPAQARREMVCRGAGAKSMAWQRPPSYGLPLPDRQRQLTTGEVIEGSR